jgi:hypothetical protein
MLSFSQINITFDEDTPGYTVGHQGAATFVTSDVSVGPSGTSGNDDGGNAIKHTVVSDVGSWAYPFILWGTTGSDLNSTLGKFISLKFISPVETGSINLYLWVPVGGDAVKQVAINTAFTGASSTVWKTIEFDCSTLPEGYISRMDVEFKTGTGQVAGDVYYIDDIKQTAESVLSNDEFVVGKKKVSVYPNPSSGLVNISDITSMNTIRVVNVLGKTIKTLKAENTINISELNKGIYFLIGDNGFSHKVVKK